MIETFIWQVIVLLVTSMLHPLAFVSSFLLMVVEEFGWLNAFDAAIYAGGALAFPSVTTANLTAYTVVWLEQGGGVVMVILLFLVVVPLCWYLFFMSKYPVCINPRRLQQVTSAMILVYAVILCLAAVKLLSFAIPIGVISTAIIFIVSFALLKKTRMPLFMVLAMGILIAIFLV